MADRLAVVRNCELRQLLQLLQRFDTWHVSRRLRTKAAREPLSQSRAGYARNRISQAASLRERLCRRGLDLRRQPCALWHDVPPPGTFSDVPGGIQRERTRRSGGAVRSQGVRMPTEQSTPTTAQVAMTLAAIAATAATPRPSGETLAEQQKRMFLGVGQQLANPSLATGTRSRDAGAAPVQPFDPLDVAEDERVRPAGPDGPRFAGLLAVRGLFLDGGHRSDRPPGSPLRARRPCPLRPADQPSGAGVSAAEGLAWW
ncbi:hypothetical protein ABTZ03_42660 [Kitasatospora sp. NPDC096077]|uniref:hypothetical protein n=1 Tax=Kitasatospora sp. NPDC096077 TaxID=3155544 RepID=UPI00331FFFF0